MPPCHSVAPMRRPIQNLPNLRFRHTTVVLRFKFCSYCFSLSYLTPLSLHNFSSLLLSSSPRPYPSLTSLLLTPTIDLTLLLRQSLLAERLFNLFPVVTASLRIRHDTLFTYISPSNSTPPSFPSVDISYCLFGRGPQKVVFIPGMCVSHSVWSHQLQALRHDSKYTILLIDNRGSGTSSVPPASLASAPGYDITTMARDALAVIDIVFGRQVKFHLVGHSMGSMIAQRLALLTRNQKPQHRIVSLTLLSSHDGGWFWNNCPTPIMVRALFDLVRTGFDDHATADVHLRMHYTNQFLEEYVIDDMSGDKVLRRDVYYKRYLDGIRRDRKKNDGGDGFWGHLAAVRTHNLTRDEAMILSKAEFPKIVVYGEEDEVVLPRASRELARRIGAASIGIGGSHFIIDEAAHEVNRILLFNFSRGNRAASGEGLLVHGWDWIFPWVSEKEGMLRNKNTAGRKRA